MARGPEGRFWKKVRGGWIGHSQRVEAGNGESEAGTPDAVLSVGGKGGWVELKVWPDNVSAKQLAWHVDAQDRGAYVVVLSQLPDGKAWVGCAQAYDDYVQRKCVPRGCHLQAALDCIRCSLIRKVR